MYGTVAAQHEQPDERCDPRQQADQERPDPEVRRHHFVVVTIRIGDEERGRDKRRDQHPEDPDRDRRGVEPARPEAAFGVARRDAARRDAPEGGAEHERRDDRRDPERRCENALSARSLRHLAEREAGTANDDAHAGEDDRDVERSHDRAERLAERGPAHDGGEDEPDVVGFPHRSHCVVDEAAGPLAAARPTGGEIPETGPVVGAAEDRVHDDGEPEDARGRDRHQTRTFSPAGRSAASSLEPQWSTRPVGNVGVGELVLIAPPPGHDPERGDQSHRDEQVQHDDEREGDPDATVVGDRVLGAQHVVHDPWLSTDFGDDPARLDRDQERDTGHCCAPQEPARLREASPSPPHEAEPEGEQCQGRSGQHHDVERQVHDVRRWPVVGFDRIETLDLGVGAPASEERREVGNA